MKKNTVLAVVPYYPGNRKTIKHVLRNLANQDYPVHTLIIINNTRNRQADRIKRLASRYFDRGTYTIINMGKVKGYATDKKVTKKSGIISEVYNRGYAYAILNNYDYAMIVPGDVLIPNVCVSAMLDTFTQVKNVGVVCLTCYYRNPYANMPMLIHSLDEGDKLSSEDYFSSPLYEAVAGNGAMMAPINVIQKIRWRTEPADDLIAGNDYQFCIDVKNRMNLKTIIRTDLEVIHMDPDGKTLYHSRRVPEMENLRSALKSERVKHEKAGK